MNFDVNNVVKKLKKLESTLVNKLEAGTLYSEVKRFADGKAQNLRQKVRTSKDAKKLLAFIEQRKKQIEKIAANLPGEVKVLRSYVKGQRKELEKLGNELIKKARAKKLSGKDLREAVRTATTKKAAPKRASSTGTRKAAGTTKKTAKRK